MESRGRSPQELQALRQQGVQLNRRGEDDREVYMALAYAAKTSQLAVAKSYLNRLVQMTISPDRVLPEAKEILQEIEDIAEEFIRLTSRPLEEGGSPHA